MINLVASSGRPKDKLVQKVLSLDKVNKEKLKFPMLLSQKIDGVFCLALKDAVLNQVEIFSRTGERYTSMKHIEAELYQLMDFGEIIIFEAFSPKTKIQSTISGWCRDTKGQHPELIAACHDLLTYREFAHSGVRPYAKRYSILEYRRCNRECANVTLLSQGEVNSLEEAMEFTKTIWSIGGEGVVLRNPDGLYAPGKRNADMIKIKKGVSYDLQVLDMYEGKGKYKGTLGGLICKWRDGETIRISGMTDWQRRCWWVYPPDIIGKIIQVDAMAESSKGKLREPRFKGIRTDKMEGDF